MVDLTLPLPAARSSRWRTDWSRAGVLLTRRHWWFLFALLFALGWSGVMVEVAAEYAQKKCELAVGQIGRAAKVR